MDKTVHTIVLVLCVITVISSTTVRSDVTAVRSNVTTVRSDVTEGCDCEAFKEVLEVQQGEIESLQTEKREAKLERQKLRQQLQAQQETLHSLIHALLNGQEHKNSDGLEEEHVEELLLQLRTFGVRGISGRDGQHGRDGKDGRDGVAGPPGLPGAKGEPGDAGEVGSEGPPGVRGDVGSQGSPGVTGDVGPKGLPGPTGSPGAKGDVGLPGPQGSPGNTEVRTAGGAVYTRWGRTTCGSDSVLQYKGFAGGSYFDYRGGGANYQCMPLDPEYNKYYTSSSGWYGSRIRGAEYQSYSYGIFSNHDQNVPCARCYTEKRGAMMMVPAKRTCPGGWTKEYEGYLMTERYNHHRATYECVDASPENIRGMKADTNGALFYFVKTDCTTAGTTGHCPPYYENRELTCVVCTK